MTEIWPFVCLSCEILDMEIYSVRPVLDGELVPLKEFNYSTNAFMGCVMKENYKTVNFIGVSVSSGFLSLVFAQEFNLFKGCYTLRSIAMRKCFPTKALLTHALNQTCIL